MNDDQATQSQLTCYTYDSKGRFLESRPSDADAEQSPLDASPTPASSFEHDAAKRVFRLTAADGSTEVFRDNPTRYLCLEPDPETGEMRPVVKRGKPVYLYLAREEREVR